MRLYPFRMASDAGGLAGSDIGAPSVEPSWLLQGKVRVPALPAGYVRHASVLQRLEGVLQRRVTALQAPGGFGKTTVLADIAQDLAEHGVLVGWMSLDGEDTPNLFGSYRDRDVCLNVGSFRSYDACFVRPWKKSVPELPPSSSGSVRWRDRPRHEGPRGGNRGVSHRLSHRRPAAFGEADRALRRRPVQGDPPRTVGCREREEQTPEPRGCTRELRVSDPDDPGTAPRTRGNASGQGVSLPVLGAVRAAGIYAVARWARSCRTEGTRAA